MSAEALWKMGVTVTPTRSEFDYNQISAQKKRQKHKPHTLMKVYTALLSTLVGHRIYPMAEFTVESPALGIFKTHQDKPCATWSNLKGGPALSRRLD